MLLLTKLREIVTKSIKKKISNFLPMTLWHHLTGFFTLPVYLITITCHSIYDSIHCFGIIAVQSHSLDSPDDQKNQDKVLLQENKWKTWWCHVTYIHKDIFFSLFFAFQFNHFSFSTPQTMGGHPEQIFAFCYESINQFIHASHSFHFHFLLFLFVTLMHFIFTFIGHYHLLTNNPKQGERYPVGYLLIWQHCFIWQCWND